MRCGQQYVDVFPSEPRTTRRYSYDAAYADPNAPNLTEDSYPVNTTFDCRELTAYKKQVPPDGRWELGKRWLLCYTAPTEAYA